MLIKQIEKIINEALSPSLCRIIDISAGHENHLDAPPPGPSHLKIIVTSDIFTDMPLIQRHKTMNTLLKKEIALIHAVSFDLKSPQETTSA